MREEWEHASRTGDALALARLADAGLDINARDAHGQTGLMLAANRGHAAAVMCLIARGADLNHTAKFHLSALMLAVICNHREVVRALVEVGADLSIRGTGAPGFHGFTALDLAAAQGADDLVAILNGTSGKGDA